MDEGGAENNQFFLQEQAGGEPRRITDGKSRNMGPQWSPSGDLLAWSSNARNGRDMDLYVAAPGDPHFVRRFKEVSGQWTVADWSPDETRVAAVEYVSINESYIHIIEIATGKTETITLRPRDPKAEPVSSPCAAMVEGRPVALLPDRQGKRIPPVGSSRSGLRSHRDSVADNIPWDVEEFDLSDDGNLIAWVINEAGVDRIWVGRTRGDGLREALPLLGLPRGASHGPEVPSEFA